MAGVDVRIDLEELERKAEAALMSHPTDPWLWTGGQLDCYASVFCPPVAIALIARIRELEEALSDALAYTIPGDERDRLVQVLAEWPKVKEGK